MPLGIGFKPVAGGLDRHVLADRGHDILQGAPFRRVVEHVVDGDQRHRRKSSDLRKLSDTARVIATIEHAGGEPDGFPGGGVLQPRQELMHGRGID